MIEKSNGLNGLGGKIETNELPLAAMEREFKEECGVSIPQNKWRFIGIFGDDYYECYCYVAVTDRILKAKTITPEKVGRFDVLKILINELYMYSNIPYLIAVALDENIDSFDIKYK